MAWSYYIVLRHEPIDRADLRINLAVTRQSRLAFAFVNVLFSKTVSNAHRASIIWI